MKFSDRRAGWSVEGTYITSFPAGQHLTEDEMLAYYHLQPGDDRYADLQRASRYVRVVLKKPNGNFVVAPCTPHVTEVS